MTVRLGLLLGSLLVCSPSWATVKESIKADPSEFPDRRAQIEKAIADSDRYSELTRTQREELKKALDRMESTLASVESVSSLDPKIKVQLFNDQELVNTTLTQAAEDSRLICRQQVATGSHRARPKCNTVGEIRRQRNIDQESIRRNFKSGMRAPGD